MAALNVLQVIPSIAAVHGGPSLAILSIERALAAQGCSVTTVTTDDAGPGLRLAGEDVPAPARGVERIYCRKRTEFYKVAPGMGQWLWTNVRRFDTVHIHALFSFSTTAAAMVTRRLGVPYVLRPLGTLSGYGVNRRRPWMKRLSLACVEGPALRHAAAVHFTSRSEEQEARLLGIKMTGVVIPLGIEASRGGNHDRLLSNLGIPPSGPKILVLARIDPVKNFEGLFRALAILRRGGLTSTLLVGGAGESNYIGSLRDLARREGVGDQILWLGHVGGQAKADILAAADVFVLPSFSENFGLAALEALAVGLPCVLGRGVALAEEVMRAGAGVIVDPEPASIAAGLRRFLVDPAARRFAGTAAVALFTKDFSLERMGERLVSLYRSILDPRPRRAEWHRT